MVETSCHWHWKDKETGTISFVRTKSPAYPYCCCPAQRSCGRLRSFHRACDCLPTRRDHLAESGGEEGDCRYRHHRQGATRLRCCCCRHHWLGRTCRQWTEEGKGSITADLPRSAERSRLTLKLRQEASAFGASPFSSNAKCTEFEINLPTHHQ